MESTGIDPRKAGEDTPAMVGAGGPS